MIGRLLHTKNPRRTANHGAGKLLVTFNNDEPGSGPTRNRNTALAPAGQTVERECGRWMP